MLTSDFRYAAFADPTDDGDRARPAHAVARHRRQRRRVQPRPNGLFLRPFAFPDQDRLVYINETAPKWNLAVVGINYPDFHAWREGVKLCG